jgi:hypothetical protein
MYIVSSLSNSSLFIRQELNKRGAFDFKESDTVNYRSLLQRLVVELVKDEDIKNAQNEKVVTEKIETAMEASKRIREEKKQVAIERSRQRQADPNYFNKISESNVEPEKVEAPAVDNGSDAENEDVDAQSNDPFASFASKKSSAKIHIR